MLSTHPARHSFSLQDINRQIDNNFNKVKDDVNKIQNDVKRDITKEFHNMKGRAMTEPNGKIDTAPPQTKFYK